MYFAYENEKPAVRRLKNESLDQHQKSDEPQLARGGAPLDGKLLLPDEPNDVLKGEGAYKSI